MESIQIFLVLDSHLKAALKQWLANDPRPAQLIPTIVTMSRHNAASNVHDLRGVVKHNVSNLIYVPLIAPNTLPFKSLGLLKRFIVFHENIHEMSCKMNRKYSQDIDKVLNNDL